MLETKTGKTSDLTAVIIAGGKGTRLSHYTEEIPKPMLPLEGKPVLEYQIEQLRKYGIRNIFITVGYLKDAIIDYFQDGSDWDVNIEYIEENEPLGTAGAFYYLKDKITGDFFVIYGDVIFDMDLESFYTFHLKNNARVTLVAHPNSHPHDSDLVVCNDNDNVIRILKKKEPREGYYRNLVNAGAYIMDSEILVRFEKPEKVDLEKGLIKGCILEGQVYAYRTSEYLKDMGTYDRMDEVTHQIRSGIVKSKNLKIPQKCIFLDRDGTINKMKGLISAPEQMELEDNAAEAIRLWNSSGYLCLVVTNQPVIARNLCDFDTLETIHNKMETLLGYEGAYIDDIFYCPHHPDSGYPEERKEFKIKCKCRKPEIGMIENASEKYSIDFENSWFIGDTTTDIKTGKNAGIKTILVKTGERGLDGKYDVTADMECTDLLDAAKYIV